MDDDKLFDSDPQDDQEKPRLKVTDRRKFDRDGNPIAPSVDGAETGEPIPEDGAQSTETVTEEGSETTETATEEGSQTVETAPDDGTAAQAASRAAAENPSGDMGDEQPSRGAGERDDPRIAAPAPSMADLPRDFSAFVETLYLEAMLYLGAIADPRTGEVMEDVELAKYKIDLLGMLQGKTEGNLTVDEQQQLEEVLYQLRMIYLQKSKTVNLG